MPSPLKIAILVLNYNGLKHLKNLLPTTEFLKGDPRCVIYLVDNASYDESIAFTLAHFPWVKIIRNDENYGWGEGYNQAIGKIKNDDFSHYMFLNNDVFLSPSWFSEIISGIEQSQPSIGEWGCRAVFAQKFLRETLGTVQIIRGKDPIFYFAPMPDYGGQKTLRQDSQSFHIQLFCQPYLPKAIPVNLIEKMQIPPGYTHWYKMDIISRRKDTSEFRLDGHLKILDQISLGKFTILAVTGQTDAASDEKARKPIPLHNDEYLIVLRFVYDSQELIPLIQNSGIGLTRGFQAFDMGWFEEAQWPQPAKTAGICGVCKIVKVEHFHELGGFDPQFFMYYEDVEFSLRLHKKGYQSQVLEKALLPHVHAGSSVAHSAFFLRQVGWSIFYFHFRHGSPWRRIKTYITYVLYGILSDDKKCYHMSSNLRLALSRFHHYFGNWFKYIKGS